MYLYVCIHIYIRNRVGMCIDDHHIRVSATHVCLRYTSVSFYLSVCLSIFYICVSVPASSPGPGGTHDRRKDELSVHVHIYIHTYIYTSLSFSLSLRSETYAYTQSPIVVLPPPCSCGRASRSDRKGLRERTKGPHCDVSPARLKTASTTRVLSFARERERALYVRACVYIIYIPAFLLTVCFSV